MRLCASQLAARHTRHFNLPTALDRSPTYRSCLRILHQLECGFGRHARSLKRHRKYVRSLCCALALLRICCASLILFVIVCMCVLCAGRVKHYKDSISGNLLLPAHPTSKIELDLLIRKMHSLQLVTVRAVAPVLENNLIVKYKGVAPSTSGQVPLHLSCDCYEFWGNGDVCPCVLVAADHLDVISLETWLSTLAPRRTVGRPRRIFDGNCRKPDAAPSQQPKKRSAEWFLQEIRKQPALYYHRWRTLTLTLSLTPIPNPTTTGGASHVHLEMRLGCSLAELTLSECCLLRVGALRENIFGK